MGQNNLHAELMYVAIYLSYLLIVLLYMPLIAPWG